MEDLSISELPELLNLADDDLIEVVDFSEPDPAKKNKKLQVATLKAWIQALIDASIGEAVPAPGLSVSTTQSNVSTNGGTNGSITATGSGGTGPYTYNLNGGAYQGSGTFSGLASGTYSVGVKDSTGATFSKSVTLTQPAGEPTYNSSLTTGQQAEGVTLTAQAGVVFKFNAPQPGGDPFPAVMELYAGGTAIGQVDFNAPYIGQVCGIVYNGTTYHKTFTNGTLNILA
ncbi:SprB repeat-containing protein [Rufibacter soli]